MSTSDDSRSALLFIPDISGFTQFVKATEISHSRHIIEELLGKLLEANEIGMRVSEIEGDAILFYRFGDPPSGAELFQQVRKMFVAFHSVLKVLETRRICQCGACTAAPGLTLKVVAHFGEISETQIGDHTKLFGENVIAVHRLLKNDIPHHEYGLFTAALRESWADVPDPGWAPVEEGSQEYDVGPIDFGFVALGPLKNEVPEPRVEDFSIPGATVHVFSTEREIEAPMDLVFAILTDLPTRLHWMLGAKEIALLNNKVDRIGTKHRCIVDEKSPVMVTSGSSRSEQTITLTETDENRTMASVYTLRSQSEAQTLLQIDGFVKNNLILRIMFRLLMRKKLAQWFEVSGGRLKVLCEEAYRNELQH